MIADHLTGIEQFGADLWKMADELRAKPSDSGPIFLGIKNVTDDGLLDFTEIRHVSETEFPKWTRRVQPQKDDIVFSYEATLHRYARIPDNFEGCLGRRMALGRVHRVH